MRGINEMVRKAGMALLRSFQSIFVTLIIISAPVKIRAGPVQYTGMLAAQHRKKEVSDISASQLHQLLITS